MPSWTFLATKVLLLAMVAGGSVLYPRRHWGRGGDSGDPLTGFQYILQHHAHVTVTESVGFK